MLRRRRRWTQTGSQHPLPTAPPLGKSWTYSDIGHSQRAPRSTRAGTSRMTVGCLLEAGAGIQARKIWLNICLNLGMWWTAWLKQMVLLEDHKDLDLCFSRMLLVLIRYEPVCIVLFVCVLQVVRRVGCMLSDHINLSSRFWNWKNTNWMANW